MKLLNNYENKDKECKEFRARLTNAQQDMTTLVRDKEKAQDILDKKLRELTAREVTKTLIFYSKLIVFFLFKNLK